MVPILLCFHGLPKCKRSKLQEEQEILEAEITATALEGEGKFHETDRDNFVSRAT